MAVCDTTWFFGSLLPGWSTLDDIHRDQMLFLILIKYCNFSNHDQILLHTTRCDPTRWSFVWSRDLRDHLSQSPIQPPGGQVVNFPSWWSLYQSLALCVDQSQHRSNIVTNTAAMWSRVWKENKETSYMNTKMKLNVQFYIVQASTVQHCKSRRQ